MTGPRVDVGIPAFGRPGFLAEAIDSVRAQTGTPWRLLVSEDAARAGPGHVRAAVECHAGDPRIAYHGHAGHVGAARNMTGLIAAGDAPYVAILHDDDRWDPGFLAVRVAFLERHPACSFVFSANREIDATGAVTGRSRLVLAEGEHPSAAMVPFIFANNPVATPSALVRRSALAAVGSHLDPAFPVIYDWELWLRLAARFPVGYLARWDCDYRRHRHQVSKDSGHPPREHLDFADHAERLAAAAGIELPPALVRRKRADWGVASALDAAEAGQPRAAVSRLRAALRQRPTAALDSRVPFLAVALLGGRPARRVLAWLREQARRRRVRTHLRGR